MFIARGPFENQEKAKQSLAGCVNPLCRYWVEEREDGWVVVAEQVSRARTGSRTYHDSGPPRQRTVRREEVVEDEGFDDWDVDDEGDPEPEDL